MQVEKRTIEFIPEDERYGRPSRLFTIWFSNNMTLPSVVVGTLGIVFGLNLFWTCIAIVIGNFVGQIFTSAHSAQGPHLGIPQMIQSRAQFGVYGAMLPLLMVCLSYVVSTAAFGIIGSGPLSAVFGVSVNAAIVIIGVITVAVCFVGYELIHRIAYVTTITSTLLFAVAAYLALQQPLPPGALESSTGFVLPMFLLMITQAISVSLGFGVYVADYSRYLPSSTPTALTYIYTFGGNFLGGSLIMIFGAILAATVEGAVNDAGSATASLFGRFGVVAQLFLLVTVLQINVMNVYSTYMSATTIFSGIHGARGISQSAKVIIILLSAGISTVIAIITKDNFVAYFSNMLIGVLYMLVPWSAINLMDFYVVRKGKYSVNDIYDADGIYGRFNAPGIIAYFVAVIAQVPFMGFSFYYGPFYQWIGADLSWVVGLIVPAVVYYVLMRSSSRVLTAEKTAA